ncbi:unnamed protein product [Euphydryas editha]|uniref:Nucleocapsid protein n=1 Tax=Euphydryas editha TaxID=104508 RepID=A0AAU9TNJ0_EUPED|nr:unnamed protein product [Euphydryas editha]
MRRGSAQPSKSYKTVTVGDSTMEVCEGTEPKSDLLFLLTVFITRGNNVANILLKCDTTVRDVISRKCSQYGISTSERQKAGPLGPSVITLARLSQAFAPATASVILGHSRVGNLKSKLFAGVTLPVLMTQTIFPVLLREEDTELIEISKYLNLEIAIMLSTPKEKRRMMSMALSDLLEQSESYVMDAVNGSVTGPSIKRKALIKGNILTEDDAPTQTVRVMTMICGRLHNMANDTYFSAVRKMAGAAAG